MKKFLNIICMVAMSAVIFTACGGNTNPPATTPTTVTEKPAEPTTEAKTEGAKAPESSSNFKSDFEISVVSREDGSGTRGAFIELFGVEVKGEDGTKKDMTTDEAIIGNKTDIIMTNVASDDYAIGYISLGSLNDTVKAVKIEDVEASAANVKSGEYKAFRPFNIATKGEATGLAKDFIDFILSKEGQEVVAKSYIAVNDSAPAYAGTKPSGKITVAGSSSVTPIMEKLKEAYVAMNPSATIEVQLSDSTAGMTSAMEGTCDIGMSSRALKDTEKAVLTSTEIALDGLAVIVNKNNPLENLTKDQVKAIYTGETTNWSEVIK